MAEQLTAEMLSGILKSHGEWLDGRKGDWANLRAVNLRGAILQDADLCGADLWNAKLYATNLRGADLRNAELQDAKLQDAKLQDSLLLDAHLQGVKLQGATLPTGEKWETYCSIVVPALCAAGGQSSALVAEAWECHTWPNCPMAVAFGVQSLDEIPILHQPRVRQFIHFFDAKLIPNPFA